MVTSYYGARFNQACRQLRKMCPCKVLVQVRTVPRGTLKEPNEHVASRCWPFYDKDTGTLDSFVLYIERGWKEGEAVDALIHEWAHALDIAENGEPAEHHRDSWGKFHSRCYRAVNG